MRYIIDSEYRDVRLDKFLRKHLQELSLTEIFKGIRVGKIKVNGKKSKENYRLQKNDIVDIYYQIEKKETIEKTIIPEKEIKKVLDMIVYEDEKVIILNKKENVVIHKGSGHQYGISEILKEYLKNDNFNFVNRIDKDTSGLVIGAKNLVVTRELSEEIRNRNIVKKYYILVDGVINENSFTIKSYLKKIEDRVIETTQDDRDGKESISYFKVIKRGKNSTLLEGELETGRTHQLRVQLSQRGNFILGDKRYGKSKEDSLYLFSHYLKIKKYNIELNMEIPEKFKIRLSK